MNTTQKLNFGAIICNTLIILSTLAGLIIQWIVEGFQNSILYFVSLTSIWTILSTVIILGFNIKNLKEGTNLTPRPVFNVYLSSVIMVSMNLFLYEGGWGLNLCNLFLHIITPVLAIISYIFFAHSKWIETQDFTGATIPVYLYFMFYVIFSAVDIKHDFYNFCFGNMEYFWALIIICLAVSTSSILLGFIYALLHNTFHVVVYNPRQTMINGKSIPNIGLGTWLMDDKTAEAAVEKAIKVGYRHIDTAQAYDNEIGVGQGIKNSGIKRNELFVTTKVKAEYKTYEEAKMSIDASLQKLGLEYLDLVLIHCPQPWSEYGSDKNYDKENVEVWRALEDAYKEKKVRAIGVSNFNVRDLKNIISNCTIKPMVNQILCHVGFTPTYLIDFCKENHIVVEAYSPIAHGSALKDIRIRDVASLKRVSVSRLCIKYCLDLGLVALPKASSSEHIKENFDMDISLSIGEFELLKIFDDFVYDNNSKYPSFIERNYYEID